MAQSTAEELWRSAWEDVRQNKLAVPNFKSVDLDDVVAWASTKEIETFVRGWDRAISKQKAPSGPQIRVRKRHKLSRVVHTLHRYAPAFDVFVQQQPVIATVTWGACRFLVQAAYSCNELSEKIDVALTTIFTQLGRYEREADLYTFQPRVRASIQTLFGGIIAIIAISRVHQNKSKIGRLLVAAFSDPFDEALKTFAKSVDALDRELRTAAQEVQAHENTEQSRYRNQSSFILARIERNTCLLPGSLKMVRDTGGAALFAASSAHRLLPDSVAERTRNWLSPCVIYLEPPAVPAPGTCEAVYAQAAWKEWEGASCALPLLLSGVLGAGKTTTAKSIRDRYKQRGDRVILSYFFDSCFEATITAKACVISLLWQLCEHPFFLESPKSTFLWHTICPDLNTYRVAAECQLGRLLQILDKILDRLGPYLLVVDSLDQCREDLDHLTDHLTKLAARSNSQVIITSRTYIPPQISEQKFAHVCLERKLVEPDICSFITNEIERTPRLHKLGPDILRVILEHSEGNFLHASLLIQDLKTSSNTTVLKAKMASFATKLAAEYERLFAESSAQLTLGDRDLRDDILRLVIMSKRPQDAETISLFMSVDDVNYTINYENVAFEPAPEIVRLCQPFVQISDFGHVLLIHESAKQFLLQNHLAMERSDLFLARKCLAVLSQSQYNDPQTAVDMLRRHILGIPTEGFEQRLVTKDSPVYEYAALYFQEHVAAVSEPPEDLIEMLARFLQDIQYVTWSETLFDLKKQAGFGGQLAVLGRLSTWRKFLPPRIRARIPLDDFYAQPHLRLARTLRDDFRDKLLQYLPQIRIGDFYNAGGQSTAEWQKAYESKAIVVSGTTNLLGSEDPIVLRSRASLLREYFWQKRFLEALQELLPLVDSLRRVVGEESADLYSTLWLLGWAYFCLARFQESSDTYQEALRGLERLLGSSNRSYLIVQLYEGHRLEQLFLFGEALLFYSNIVEVLSPVVGPINGFVAMAQTALGAVQRKQGNYPEAEKNLFEGWASRKQIFSINVNVCLDAAFQLALLLRDKRDGALCLELLEEVSDSSVLEQDFERYCQMVHIRSLVGFDNDEYETHKYALLNLINQGSGDSRDKNNRELLWVRITLADVMRNHGEADDAMMLFSELVEPRGDGTMGLKDEPEPPSQLQIAEQALRLVRQAQLIQSDELLQTNNLKWVRDADFWILGEGGPVTDTAVIAPIRQTSHKGEIS